MTDHQRGLLLAAAGVIVIIPDATLIRLVDAGSLTTSLWRTGLASLALGAFLTGRYGRTLPHALRRLGAWGLLSALLSGAGTILFVLAVDNTAVANVVLILALSPMWAAILTRLLTGDATPRRTIVAMPVAVVGVVIAVGGSFNAEIRLGDTLALAASLGLAANLTIVRAQHHVDMVPAAAVGSLFGFIGLLVWGTPIAVAAGDVTPLLALGLIVIPGAIGLLTAGARYLSSPETALLLLGETALSPILAAIVVGETITTSAYVGGTIVIGALAAHAAAGLRSTPMPAPPLPGHT